MTNTCLFVCGQGVCQGVCEPGSKQCSAGDEQTCNELGQWTTTAICEFACADGECFGECEHPGGETRCNGPTGIQLCGNDHMWQDLPDCDSPEVGRYFCAVDGTGEAYCGGCDTGDTGCVTEDGVNFSAILCNEDHIYEAPVPCPEGCHGYNGLLCNTCGDDIKAPNSAEECDGADLTDPNGGIWTCQAAGFVGGEIACSDNCQLDTSGCEN